MLLVVGLIAYDMWSSGNVSDNGITADTVRTGLDTIGTEQSTAGSAIRESQSITTTIQQSNNNIRSTNSEIKSTIDVSQQLNKSSADCIARDKQILRDVRKSGTSKN